jgi:hypothetical protein
MELILIIVVLVPVWRRRRMLGSQSRLLVTVSVSGFAREQERQSYGVTVI